MSRIIVNPEILGGKPVVEGTRLSVEHVLGLLASGMSDAEIIEAYPELNAENIRAVLAYASRAHREQSADSEREYYIGLAKQYANMGCSPLKSDESVLEIIGKMIYDAQQEK